MADHDKRTDLHHGPQWLWRKCPHHRSCPLRDADTAARQIFYGPCSGILVADFWVVRKKTIKREHTGAIHPQILADAHVATVEDLYLGNCKPSRA